MSCLPPIRRLCLAAGCLALALLLAVPLTVQAGPPGGTADDHWSFRAPGTAPPSNYLPSRVPVKTDTSTNWSFHSPIAGFSPSGSGKLTSPGGGFQGPKPAPNSTAAGRAGCGSPGGG